MTRFGNKKAGWTLTELMIVVAILGIVTTAAPRLYQQIRRFFFLSNARVDLQRDARNCMGVVTKGLRQAVSSSIEIQSPSGQPYYSRINFTDIDGRTVSYYQSNRKLNMVVNGSTRTLTDAARYIAFSFPRSDDMSIVSVAMTLEKSIYEGKTKALHMASEKVRVMN